MDTATFAIIIGITEIIIGVPLVLFPAKTTAWLKNAMLKDVYLRTVGVILLVVCVLTLKEDPSVSAEPSGLVRLIAWVGAIKGLTSCWAPRQLIRISESLLAKEGVGVLAGLIAVVIGILFLWYAF